MDELLRNLKGLERAKYFRQINEKINDAPSHLTKSHYRKSYNRKHGNYLISAENAKVSLKATKGANAKPEYEVQRLKLLKCKSSDLGILPNNRLGSQKAADEKTKKILSFEKLADRSCDVEKQKLRELYQPNLHPSKRIEIIETSSTDIENPVVGLHGPELQIESSSENAIAVDEKSDVHEDKPEPETVGQSSASSAEKVSLSPTEPCGLEENKSSAVQEASELSDSIFFGRQKVDENYENRIRPCGSATAGAEESIDDEEDNRQIGREQQQIVLDAGKLKTCKRMCNRSNRVKKHVVSLSFVFIMCNAKRSDGTNLQTAEDETNRKK